MELLISKMTEDDVNEVFEIENELIGNASKNTISETLKNDKINYYVMKNENETSSIIKVSSFSLNKTKDTTGINTTFLKRNKTAKRNFATTVNDSAEKVGGPNEKMFCDWLDNGFDTTGWCDCSTENCGYVDC